MLKKELRKVFLNKRLLLSKEEIKLNSHKIFDNLIKNFELRSENICTFLPIDSKKEVDTFQLFNLKKSTFFNLYSTKWNTITNELTIYSIKSKRDLVINEFQIPEPKETNVKNEIDDLSIVLIPLLCFDKQGNRVGYGKGVYDKFLVRFNQKKTLFVGLSFFEPIDQIIDINEFDIKLHYCITPKTVYKFEK